MIELGLQRISRLLSGTAFPWRAIHVAGTNGKGSICAYTSSMLEAFNHSDFFRRHGLAKIKHGRFTSPHVVDKWDCVSISQAPIAAEDFYKIEDQMTSRNASASIAASEFEVLTATAFQAFTEAKLDVAVVEVGMGGRLDATNILGQPETFDSHSTSTDGPTARPPPLVSAIAKIGLDHQGFLGDTIERIAQEKAGIIKSGTPVVYDTSNQDSVQEVITDAAHRVGAPVVSQDSFNPTSLLGNLNTNDLPQHTIANLNVAFHTTITALQRLDRLPPDLNPTTDPSAQILLQTMLQSALSTTIPGRQEYLALPPHLLTKATSPQPQVLLDGAHNAQSATTLALTTDRLRSRTNRPLTWILSTSDTKPASEILGPLLRPDDAVYAVEFGTPVDGMPWVRPRSAEEIARVSGEVVGSGKLRKVEVWGEDVEGAVRKAVENASALDGGAVVIAGSLYLVGNVHRMLRRWRTNG